MAARKSSDGKTKKKRTRGSMAAQADRHLLYERSVQCVEAEINFVDKTYRKLRGKKAVLLREDFAGTCNTSCEWVRRRKTNRAICVDLDGETLAWGREHHIIPLGDDADRVKQLQGDVLTVDTRRSFGPADVVLAMNFSYWTFRERTLLLHYFRRVRQALADDGLFILDCYGGSEAHEAREETREYDDFSYIWDQDKLYPVTNEMFCHIHFEFPDGSRIRKAFSYHWRLWGLPEIRDVLLDAGFSKVTVYWEGTDRKTGEGNGIFRPAEKGQNCPSWIVYIVAEK